MIRQGADYDRGTLALVHYRDATLFDTEQKKRKSRLMSINHCGEKRLDDVEVP